MAAAAPATPPLELHHKEHIQDEVHHTGRHQHIQGGAAVAERPQNAGKHIVAHRGQKSGEDYEDIGVGVLKDSVRHFYGGHQGAQGHKGPGGEHCRQGEIEHQHGGNGPPHLPPVFRPEGLGRHNAKAAVHPGGEVHQQGIQGRSGPDGGDGVVPQGVPGDGRVRQVVHLLEDVSDKQGHGKPQDLFQGASHCHVPPQSMVFSDCHNSLLSCLSYPTIHLICRAVAQGSSWRR